MERFVKIYSFAFWVLAAVASMTNENNPCPEILKLTREDGASTVANFMIQYPKQHRNRVQVEISFIATGKGDGYFTLIDNDDQVTKDIIDEIPVRYRLTFPPTELQPKVTKIVVNGDIVCSGRPVGVYAGKTTRTVTHKSEFTIEGPLVNLTPSNRKPTFAPPTTSPPTEATTTTPAPPSVHVINRFKPADTSTVTTTTTEKFLALKPYENLDQVCGESVQINELVFGGKAVPKGKYPWLAVMYVRKRNGWDFNCVGTLISERFVVTSAHCTELDTRKLRADDMIFALGLHDLRFFATEKDSVNALVSDVYVHEDYRHGTADADIALMKLEEHVRFTYQIRPICMWRDDFGTSAEPLVGQKGSVAGWGLDESLEISSVPKETWQPIVSGDECRRKKAFVSLTSERTFCAGAKDNTGPCNGDSGSGFNMKIASKWYLRGVTALSLKNVRTGECDLANYVVYTDAAKFKQWIRSVTGIAFA